MLINQRELITNKYGSIYQAVTNVKSSRKSIKVVSYWYVNKTGSSQTSLTLSVKLSQIINLERKSTRITTHKEKCITNNNYDSVSQIVTDIKCGKKSEQEISFDDLLSVTTLSHPLTEIAEYQVPETGQVQSLKIIKFLILWCSVIPFFCNFVSMSVLVPLFKRIYTAI